MPLLNFLISAMMVTRTINLYIGIYTKVVNLEECQLTNIELEIAFEGLNDKLPKRLLKRHSIVNFLLKLQMLFIPIILVIGQYKKNFVCFLFLTLEVSMLIVYTMLRWVYRKAIFTGWLTFWVYLFITVIVGSLSIIGLFGYQWHSQDYLISNTELNLKKAT